MEKSNDLMSLVELQKFLADELVFPGAAGDFSRAFLPLTDGLGLESPTKEAPPMAETPPVHRRALVDELFDGETVAPRQAAPPPRSTEERLRRDTSAPLRRDLPPTAGSVLGSRPILPEDEEDILPTERVAARSIGHTEPEPLPVEVREEQKTAPIVATPPPLPRATFTRRFAAGMLDQVFVLSLWGFGVAATVGLLNDGSSEISTAVMREFSNAQFVRYAALEFTVIWLAYLALGVGLLDMTFGMWVWGLRYHYRGSQGDGAFLRKLVRVVFGFFFYAPVAPTLLLLPRRRGRTVLDWMSGSALYRSTV